MGEDNNGFIHIEAGLFVISKKVWPN